MHFLPIDELRVFAGRGRAPDIPVLMPKLPTFLCGGSASSCSVNATIPYPGTITMQESFVFSDARIVEHHENLAGQKNRLSVLYVDDEPVFLDLCKIYLERGGEISLTCTTSPYEALELVRSSRFDVIVSDYQMPDLDGIGFLKQLKERNCSIPFILFTVRGRDEVLLDAIRHGADFYLQKGGDPKSQFAELIHTIKEAAKRWKAEEILKKRESRYRTMFENTGTAMIIIEEDTSISLANLEFLRLTGYSQEDLNGKKSWTEFVVKEDLERMLAQHRLRRERREAALRQYEFRLITKTGEVRNILVTAEIIPETQRSVASLIDITSLRKAEEELERKNQEIAVAYQRITLAEEAIRHNIDDKPLPCGPLHNNELAA
jgi:PAS domain S-box-containing protein